MGFEKSEETGYTKKGEAISYGAGTGSDAAPGFVTGVFLANKNGYGFVRPDVAEGEESKPDIFIPASAVHQAFHMDRVEVRLQGVYDGGRGNRGERRTGAGVPSGPKQEGEITRILSHGITQVVGLFVKKKDHAYVIPDREAITQHIYVDRPHTKGAVNGHKVVVRLTSWGTKTLHPEGRVTEILGHADDPGTDILSVVKAYEIPTEFPKDVMEQTEKIPSFVSEEEMAGKPDLRGLKTVTIDGEDAKDLDDAITLERTAGGYRLGAHIADVSYYVTEGSPLDREALKRGTSVYLVDRVIPMLPHKLSNGICSLNEGEDRLALSCIMDLDAEGKIVGHEIAETVIRVDHRMSYTDVQRILDLTGDKKNDSDRMPETAGADENETMKIAEANRDEMTGTVGADNNETTETDGTDGKKMMKTAGTDGEKTEDLSEEDRLLLEKYQDVISLFHLMTELSARIRQSRFERGAIDFDFPESKIKIDKKGRPTDVVPYERNTATDIIEDFMLMANETVAEDYFWQEVPFLYRTHEKPDEEKMRKMMTILSGYGYTMHPGRTEIHPKEIQKVLLAMRGTPEEPMLSRILLRSMKQAKYTPQCTGHFGLSARYYTHFTSPIRRYPDLQIHRIIRENLSGGISDRRRKHYEHILPEVGVQTSELERRADEAERETDKMKKAEYMMRHIGESYEGIISGVTQSGIYVELPNTVEGFIRISELKEDYFTYDRDGFELIGEVTNIRYRLGQKIRVTVADASKQRKTVDFVPAE